MSLPNLFYFYRRRLRDRVVQELLALLGLAVGVALLFAVQTGNSSLSSSVAGMTHGLIGDAQFQVVGRDAEGFRASVVEQIARTNGITVAAPVVEAEGNLQGPTGDRAVSLLAADGRIARLGGTLLSSYSSGRFGTLHAVAVPTPIADRVGVRFGDTATLQIAGRMSTVLVGGTVTSRDVGALTNAPVVLAPLAFGQTLAGLDGRVSRVYVRADPAKRDSVKRALQRIAGDDLDVRPADFDINLFARAAAPNDQSTSLFAAISALVGFLFAFNAMLLMVADRRAVIEELDRIGAGTRNVLAVLSLDALAVGLAASLLGILLGDQLSRHLFPPAPGYLTLAFPVGTTRILHWQTAALAITSGVLAALLAALAPLMPLLMGRTREELEEGSGLDRPGGDRTSRSAWLLSAGAVLLGAAVFVLIAAPKLALVGMGALILSLLLVLPLALRSALALMDWVIPRLRIRPMIPMITSAELRSSGSRSVAIAAIAAIAVLGATAIEGAHHDLQHGLDGDVHALNAGTDVWVSPRSSANALATIPFPATDTVAAIADAPHVSAVHVYRGGFLDVGDRRVWVVAPPRESRVPIPPGQLVSGDFRLATERLRGHGWAVVSSAVAEDLHLHLGQTFTLPAPRLMVFHLAGISTNLGWTPGAIILNADDYRAAWATSDASALQVDITGASPAVGSQLVSRALGPGSPYTVETVLQRDARDQQTSRRGLARLTQISWLMLLAAALAMAAAMGGVIWERRQRVAELKVSGTPRIQLFYELLFESALVLGLGCVIGAIYGLLGARLLDRWLSALTGFPVDESIALPVAGLSFLVVAAVAFVVAAIPGWFAAKVPTTVAFQD